METWMKIWALRLLVEGVRKVRRFGVLAAGQL